MLERQSSENYFRLYGIYTLYLEDLQKRKTIFCETFLTKQAND